MTKEDQMALPQAVRGILSGLWDEFGRQRDRIAETGESEAVHHARIALRRVRSLFRLLRPWPDDPSVPELRADLRWLADELATVRQLDVALRRIGQDNARLWIETARAGALARARTALASPRAAALEEAFVRLLAAAWEDERAFADVLIPALSDMRRRLKRRGKELAGLDAERVHQLRMDAKMLRYGAEFLALPDTGQARQDFIDALIELQDRLGDIVDRTDLPAALAELGLPQATIKRLLSVGPDLLEREREHAARAFRDWRAIKPYWRQRSRA